MAAVSPIDLIKAYERTSLYQPSQSAQSTGSSFSSVLNTALSSDLDDIFQRAADTYGIPVELLRAIGKAESNFNPNAVSPAGAQGVMQLMPGTARGLGVTDSFDPEQNIMGGASYIAQKLRDYDGDVTLALAAYNAGSGNVAKYGGVPPFAETQNYIKKVLGYMEDAGLRAGQVSYSGSGTAALSGLDLSNLGALLGFAESGEDYETLVARWRAELSMSMMAQLLTPEEDEDDSTNPFRTELPSFL